VSGQFWWYLARSGGIVAWILLASSVALGLLQAGKLIGRASGRSWVADTHQFLGSLATVFVGVHLLALVADSYVYFGWSESLVPFASDWKPGPVAIGIVGFWLLVAIEITSLAKRHLPRTLWRTVHHLSLPLFVVATVHGFLAGTDTSAPLYVGAAAACLLALFVLALRRVVEQRSRSANYGVRHASNL
jgi:DMSO/TMAO reductase YedYZ heme-binding membrane subunit